MSSSWSRHINDPFKYFNKIIKRKKDLNVENPKPNYALIQYLDYVSIKKKTKSKKEGMQLGKIINKENIAQKNSWHLMKIKEKDNCTINSKMLLAIVDCISIILRF